MNMNEFKKVKCKVYRADDPDDASDIYVGVNDAQFFIKVGEEVPIPKPVYDVLVNAQYPATAKEEEDGVIRTKTVMRPRFSITVSGIETEGEANERVAKLALENAKQIDDLKRENAELKDKLSDKEEEDALFGEGEDGEE